MKKISGIYKITNTITNDFYIGSSKDVKSRWADHKCPSTWREHPNNPMYLDMKRYGLDYFVFEILEEVEIDSLKEAEQQFIKKMHPTYNRNNAKGLDVDRKIEYMKEYEKSDKYKEYKKEYMKEYKKSDKYKEYKKEYNNQLCSYNNEILTLSALATRFRRAGIEYPTKEAKKYLLKKEPNNVIEFY